MLDYVHTINFSIVIIIIIIKLNWHSIALALSNTDTKLLWTLYRKSGPTKWTYLSR